MPIQTKLDSIMAYVVACITEKLGYFRRNIRGVRGQFFRSTSHTVLFLYFLLHSVIHSSANTRQLQLTVLPGKSVDVDVLDFALNFNFNIVVYNVLRPFEHEKC